MYPVLWTWELTWGPGGGSIVYDSIIVTLLFQNQMEASGSKVKEREIIFVKVSECNHLSWSIVSGQWFCFSQKLIQLSLTYLDQGEAFSSHLELKEKKKRRHDPLTEAWNEKQ